MWNTALSVRTSSRHTSQIPDDDHVSVATTRAMTQIDAGNFSQQI
jgi:hypothetical protein